MLPNKNNTKNHNQWNNLSLKFTTDEFSIYNNDHCCTLSFTISKLRMEMHGKCFSQNPVKDFVTGVALSQAAAQLHDSVAM